MLTGSHIASSLVPASEINGKNKPDLHLRVVFFFFIGFELCYSKMFLNFSLLPASAGRRRVKAVFLYITYLLY